MRLSILIPTLPDRVHFLNELTCNLNIQISKCDEEVEIITDWRGRGITTGEKRNALLARSTGQYVWFVDDDDEILPDALKNILNASKKYPDVIGINGFMTTDGKDRVDWEIRLGHPYGVTIKDGKDYYLRHPNHITPMKRIYASSIKFPHITMSEDYQWAIALKESGLLKTQEIIEEPIYHYRFRTIK